MKLLFIHGAEKLKRDFLGNYYTDGSYNKEVWDRYLNIFGNVTVMFRKDLNLYEREYAEKKFQYFDKDLIQFVEIPDLYSSIVSYFNIKRRVELSNRIKEAVKLSDFLIVRAPGKEASIAIKLANKYKKTYMVEVVGCAWDSLRNHSLKGKVLAPISYWSMKSIAKKAPFITYVTNEFLQKRYPTNGRSIGCSDVSLPSLDPAILNKRLDKIKTSGIKKRLILGTIAAVDVGYKGQEYVIRAISKLAREGFDFEYRLVGGGDYSYLKAMAEKHNVSEKVVYLGSLSHDQVFDYLDSIDIYVQPSLSEGLPRALIEAMSRGCPCIGSNAGGIPELLSEDCIFNKGSVKGIIDLLGRINPYILSTEAQRNFEKAKQYDKKLLNNLRMEFYKDIFSRSNNK